MKGIFTLSFALVFVFTEAAKPKGPAGCLSGHHSHMHHMTPECMGTTITIPDDMKPALMECNNKSFEQFKATKIHPPQEQRACEIVCGAQGMGLLDKDGKPVNRDDAEKVIVKLFPKDMSKKLLDALSSCEEKHGKNLMIKANDCGSYKDLIECVITTGREVCGVGPPPLF